MSSRSNKNTFPSVVFFQLNGRKIKCFCSPSASHTVGSYQVIEIAVTAFEQWLDEHGYLEVKEEVYPSSDDINTTQKTVQWSYSIDEFLHSSSHAYDINELLSHYIGKQAALKNS